VFASVQATPLIVTLVPLAFVVHVVPPFVVTSIKKFDPVPPVAQQLFPLMQVTP